MYKLELIKEIAESTDYTEKAVEDIVNATLDAITDELKHGREVQLTGFGKFSLSTFLSRTVNGIDGSKIRVPKHTIAKFTPGKALREAVYKTKIR